MVQLNALIVADKESAFLWDHFDKSLFRGVDVIIACGDLKASYLSFLTTMVAAPLLYVPGNHDGHYLSNPPEGCEDLTLSMQVIKGVRFVGFGGANSLSPKPFHYSDKQMSRQVSRRMAEIGRHGGFDVLVTHAPALGLGDGDDSFHKGFTAYNTLIDMFQPTYHLHGHQHLNYGSNKRVIYHNKTTIINGYGYQLINLMVPKAAPKRKKLSAIKLRYDWGRAYAKL